MSDENRLKDLSNVQLHLVDSVETAEKFIRWVAERRPYSALAVDTETGEIPGKERGGAFSPWQGKLRFVQVGDGMQGWSIPWEQWSGVFYQAIRNHTGPIIFHNVAFDARWFAVQSEWEIPWGQVHDTMIMARIINPLESAALKTLSAKYVDPKAAALQSTLDQEMAKNGWTWGTVPISFEPYWSYGALDCVLTTRIWEMMYDKCGPQGDYHRAYELEMATRKIASKMELNGAHIDLDYSKKKYDELLTYSENSKVWAYNKYGVSISSNQQLVRAFESLGAVIEDRTPSGQKSASKDQIKKLFIYGNDATKELAELVLNQRKADKLAGTYFLNFINKNTNGILHPSIDTLAARTSRMSIKDPALQTLPKGDATVRRAFIPKDDDHVILTSDLDQVEFRMFSSLSADQNLISLFNKADAEGSDPFTQIGRQVYQDPTMQKSDKRRNLIKGVVYGRLYGAGVAKQALTAGVPQEQMQEVSDSFDANYPGMARFQKEIDQLGKQRFKEEGQGYVKTWTGRRIPCDDDRTYTLVNYLIQGGAAEVFKSNLIKLDQADLTDYLIVPVHDEIVLQAPKKDAEEIKRLVKECMTTRENWEVPLTADADGPLKNWGEKYE
jgi:DNA polymerase-1